MRRSFTPSLITLSILGATTAMANESPANLGATVVSAAGFEQKITEAPASISVISNEDLQKKRYNNLAQALGDVEGIDIGQGIGKTGGLNISFRGMPSEYTLILIDGRRQNPSGDVTPNGFGETSTSFMPPMSAIERIEVIRGPMSTLYGSDAMGGVINIITKKVNTEWSGSISADYTLQEHSQYGDTGSTSFYSSGPLVENLVGLSVRGSFWDREESNLKFSDGTVISKRGPSPVSGQKFNLGGRLDFTPTDNHDFALDFEKGRQRYDNDECQLGTLDGLNRACTAPAATTANGYADELKFERTQYALSHTGRFDIGTLESAITYNTTETIGRTIPGTIGSPYAGYPGIIGGDHRTLENKDLVVDSKLVSQFIENNITTLGAQYRHSKLEDGIAPNKFKQEAAAIFAENEWRFHPDFALTLGGRMDRHQAFGSHFSPRAYLVWNTTDNWTLKGGVSKGYKTPNLNALHSGINGVTNQGLDLTIGNPDLKPEKSTSTELAAYYDNLSGFSANATLFHTKFKDKIESKDIFVSGRPGIADDTYSQDLNIGEAVTRGIELATRWQFLDNWSIGGNYTYTESEQKKGDDKGAQLTNTPRHVANVSLNWNTTDRLSLWLKNEYRGKRVRFTSKYNNLSSGDKNLYNALGSKTKAYSLFHLGGSYRATDTLTFNATIYNLLDKNFAKAKIYDNNGTPTYATDYSQTGRSTTGGLEERRRLWVSATYEF
ncbi:TonB-dependent receptor domain-containing protein [Thiopseudomonas denitrificans]|uniref:Outer membrane receptor for ferrienterochelin and colicins n=1 Tax=Thiopseudomonas denitrificans TaxID=1501432 RepID=A0A4R6TTW7_9GAMM|nr:TonB-dependent receptor [Thiopseudomonas denitrificans]TDQ34662.1 outer membrane receptor for ferrienterochelin and colicins [Thiopseudomonas denitrificans]